MVALAGPFFMLATLLVVSGLPKLVWPDGTTQAMAAIGLPAKPALGRAVGAVEVTVGIGALLVGGAAAAAAMAIVYTAFAAFILFALRSDRVSSCGCFGQEETPPSFLHLAIDVGAAATAGALVLRPVGHIVEVMGDTPWGGMPLLVLVVMGAWLSYTVLTLLPTVFSEAAA